MPPPLIHNQTTYFLFTGLTIYYERGYGITEIFKNRIGLS